MKFLLKLLRKKLLRSLLTRDEAALLDSLSHPYRWMPDNPLTGREGEEWEHFITGSELGRKLDVAMVNWAQQQAQTAIAAPAGQIEHAAGFARGCMAGWQFAKTLSRIAATDAASSEPDATTAAAGFEHFRP
ncbi:hypothetical protein [Geminisphaera colitermitum]|uniref:hypothetical protein n=1 Tax=Geminisphaera colitermitum TaxID=1148786 RepID=UPI0001964DD3|nr:hypothetical protein [Geminisphaera colitermitum]